MDRSAGGAHARALAARPHQWAGVRCCPARRASVSVIPISGMADMDDAEGDVRWMTYAELGKARGISTASATRLAFRRKWRRQGGNDGIARVAVPVGEDQRRHDDRDDARSDDRDDITHVVSALEVSVASLTNRAEAAETRADRAENRAEQAETRADRAERAVADERNRADRAESSRDAERARSDELRDRIEALQVQLATAEADSSALTIETAELTAQLNQARRQAQEAQDAAEAIRQAEEAERQARGLLARLRAAWGGE